MEGKLKAVISTPKKMEAVVSSSTVRLGCVIEKGAAARLEESTVTPSGEEQIVIPSAGYDGLKKVTVAPIPQCYGLITYDGTKIMVS